MPVFAASCLQARSCLPLLCCEVPRRHGAPCSCSHPQRQRLGIQAIVLRSVTARFRSVDYCGLDMQSRRPERRASLRARFACFCSAPCSWPRPEDGARGQSARSFLHAANGRSASSKVKRRRQGTHGTHARLWPSWEDLRRGIGMGIASERATSRARPKCSLQHRGPTVLYNSAVM